MEDFAASPKYERIKRSLLNGISSGRYRSGSKLPSESELAKEFSVNINTAKRALTELSLSGRVVRMRGKGSFVSGPGTNARAKGRRTTFAVLLNVLEDPFYSKMLQAISRAASLLEIDIMVFDCEREAANEIRILRRLLKESSVDGCIVIPADAARNAKERKFLSRLQEAGMPLLLLYPQAEVEGCPQLRCDMTGGIREVIRHFIASGRRKILTVTHGNFDDLEIKATLAGMRLEMEAAGLIMDERNIETVDVAWFKSGYKVADKIAARPDRPDAIFAVSDELAIGMLTRFKELGIKVPDEIKMACAGDIDDSSCSEIQLSALSHPLERVGKKAVELLKMQLDGRKSPELSMLPMKFIVRET